MKEQKKASDVKQNKKNNEVNYENLQGFANDQLEKLRYEISGLSYQESLDKLDFILQKLQHDEVLVEDLQRQYLEGKLYLEHCESLLNKVQQEVIEMNL